MKPGTLLRSLRSFLMASAAVALLASACDKGPPARGAAATATPTAPAAGTGTSTAAGMPYGAGVKLAASTPIADILRDPAPFTGKTVRIEGLISDVCAKRGCWMDVAGEAAGDKLRFKVQDGDIVFPMEAKGRYAIAEGVVAVNELTLEAARDYAKYQAEEAGKPFDPASVTGPTRIVRLDGIGAVLRDRK
jgi:Domain of unknown function (DUF4920)